MPKLFLVYAAQAYKLQPRIHTGYMKINGGLGTVAAMVMAHPILMAQANNSTQKRNGYV